MTADAPADDAKAPLRPFDPAPTAALVRAALDCHLRERAPDQRLAFWKAVALGCGGVFEELAGCSAKESALPRPGPADGPSTP
ncbi:hypothetical protein [Methylobacterium sp. WL8]|uniref:hypothetical protein n=1 Tax=Methylobacterium sp. WL8 TaxID=2603899 RepID=UPI0011C99B4B|nr:hypothetical protein [Methylobacterium sp. WL8]TXN81118.1 hypothetical protein FV234_14600 [Methylobacterium sp. WL8]